MQTHVESQDAGLKVLRVIVIVAVLLFALLALYTVFIEAFAFGARPGLPPAGAIIPNIDYVSGIDHFLRTSTPFSGLADRLLSWEASYQNPDRGPEAVWRYYATWFSVIMIGTGLVMLLIKRYIEPTNDETTVTHLKGNTDTAFRAKGFRG